MTTGTLHQISTMRRESPARNEQGHLRFSRNRKSRSRGLRKRTGCLTCKRRHVKCDETQPLCKACVRLELDCSWSSSYPRSMQEPPGGGAVVVEEDNGASNTLSPAAGTEQQGASSRVTSALTGQSSGRCALSSSRTEAIDEAAAVLVEIRDGWQEPSPVVPSDSRAAAAEGVRESDTPQRHYSAGESCVFDATTPSSKAPTAQVLSASPGLSSLASNVHEWVSSDTATSHAFDVGDATHVWASLLLRDASSRTEGAVVSFQPRFPYETQENLGSMLLLSPLSMPATLAGSHGPPTEGAQTAGETALRTYSSSEAPPEQCRRFDNEPWQSPTPLHMEPHEYPLFHDFVQNLSLWMDFFDPKRPFGTLVPHLAMRNRGLMNAILALSIRHLSLNVRFQPANSHPQDPLDALPFYFVTLHYIQEAMQYESYKNSLELLATASIVSAYEMLDGSRKDWERHLRGLSCIQHSQGIHGDSGGLKQAVWWAWLCQDVWAAWREGRKPFTTWKPDKTLSQLDNFGLAARSVYNLGQAVAFCSGEEVELGRRDPNARIAKAQSLQGALKEWRDHLPADFDPLPIIAQPSGKGPFQPIWINPPCFAIAVQLFHCAQVLITTNSPCLGGMNEYKKQRAELDEHIRIICGIAMHLKSDPASVMCSQALFIAGLFVSETNQRETVLGLLQDCWRRAGWPLQSLGVELEREWSGQVS
ncbi:fungal-specific transcription factor domain-containing protein [Xylariaceae sp. FL0804]|nr:fungal-specific transcription factor domain-containing protein [Xylariaceae sp. FL0804]